MGFCFSYIKRFNQTKKNLLHFGRKCGVSHFFFFLGGISHPFLIIRRTRVHFARPLVLHKFFESKIKKMFAESRIQNESRVGGVLKVGEEKLLLSVFSIASSLLKHTYM